MIKVKSMHIFYDSKIYNHPKKGVFSEMMTGLFSYIVKTVAK